MGNCALSRLLNMASSLVKPAVTNRPTLEFLLDHLWQPPMISREQEGKRSRQSGVKLSGLARGGGMTTCNYLFIQPLVEASSKAN